MRLRYLQRLRNRLSPTNLRAAMNVYADSWDLDEVECPCDVHFNSWIEKNQLRNQVFYHFGSGNHHIVGATQARNGSGNRVVAVTASVEEYKSYIGLVSRNPQIARSYLAYFSDIYLTDPGVLPDFDAVTMFHLCEFYKEDTRSFGGVDDRQLLDIMTTKTRVGGHLLFYTGSFAFSRAEPIIEEWGKSSEVMLVERFKTLLVYEKLGLGAATTRQ
jgi:hypothetical protein